MVRGRSAVSAGLLLMLQGAVTPSLPTVEPNPNRVPAGVLAGDSLVIALEIRMASWYPEEAGGVSVDVAAFAEPGRAPEIPGPLIRVPAGTTLAGLLTELGLDARAVVVEHNQNIVRRDSLHTRLVEAGDVVEIVHFVGGG